MELPKLFTFLGIFAIAGTGLAQDAIRSREVLIPAARVEASRQDIDPAGTLTDSRGRKASFRETVIILTSNLGSSTPAGKKMGFAAALPAEGDAARDLHSRIAEAIKCHLRPELLNRISRTVVFNPLSKENIREIVEKFVARQPRITRIKCFCHQRYPRHPQFKKQAKLSGWVSVGIFASPDQIFVRKWKAGNVIYQA